MLQVECILEDIPEYPKQCGCKENVCTAVEFANCYTWVDQTISWHTNVSGYLLLYLKNLSRDAVCLRIQKIV